MLAFEGGVNDMVTVKKMANEKSYSPAGTGE